MQLAETDLHDTAILNVLSSVGTTQQLVFCSPWKVVRLSVQQCGANLSIIKKLLDSTHRVSSARFGGHCLIINGVTRDPGNLRGINLDKCFRCYVSAPVRVFNQYMGSLVMVLPEPQDFTLRLVAFLVDSAHSMVELLDNKARCESSRSRLL